MAYSFSSVIVSAAMLQLGSKLVGVGKGQGSLCALTSHPARDSWSRLSCTCFSCFRGWTEL